MSRSINQKGAGGGFQCTLIRHRQATLSPYLAVVIVVGITNSNLTSPPVAGKVGGGWGEIQLDIPNPWDLAPQPVTNDPIFLAKALSPRVR